MKQVSATIISKGEVMPGVYLIWLESPQIAFTAQPGQFIMLRCGEDTLLRRPLSIHRRDGNKIALLFTVVGKGTYWLSQRQTGDNIDLFGPLGNGFSINSASHNLLLVAGGIGIAPLRFLADEALRRECSVRLLLGASTATHLYPRHLLPPEAKLIITTEDGTADKKGMITDLLPDFIDWADQIFTCGPTEMYRDMARREQGLKLEGKSAQVSLEARMGCGRGVCYGCTVKTRQGLKQVCQDGPIFAFDDVFWNYI